MSLALIVTPGGLHPRILGPEARMLTSPVGELQVLLEIRINCQFSRISQGNLIATIGQLLRVFEIQSRAQIPSITSKESR